MISSPPMECRDRDVFIAIEVERTTPRARLPRDSREFSLVEMGASKLPELMREFRIGQRTQRVRISRRLNGLFDMIKKACDCRESTDARFVVTISIAT